MVDLLTDADSASIGMSTTFFLPRVEGESCHFLEAAEKCDAGLTCSDMDHRGTCTPNVLAEITSLVMYRGGASGNDLVAELKGTDPNGDAQQLKARIYDADGELLPWRDADGDGIFEQLEVPLVGSSLLGLREFEVTLSQRDFFLRFPTATRAVASIQDTTKESAPTFTVEIGAAPP